MMKKTMQRIREERGLSIDEVEKAANLPHNSLESIETGKHKSVHGIWKLAKLYNVEFSKELMIEYGLIVRKTS